MIRDVIPSPTPNIGELSEDDESGISYEWVIPNVNRSETPASTEKQVLPTQVYRNPRFSEPANNATKLPPLKTKPTRPKYAAFR